MLQFFAVVVACLFLFFVVVGVIILAQIRDELMKQTYLKKEELDEKYPQRKINFGFVPPK